MITREALVRARTKYRMRHRAKGLCRACSRKRTHGLYCDAHNEADKKRSAAYRKKTRYIRCRECFRKLQDGDFIVCRSCIEKRKIRRDNRL